MSIEAAPFGETADGTKVEQFTLRNGRGVTARLITYGAILTSLEAPDRHGRPAEITLGFDSLDSYLKGHPYFGAVCGRVANRIAKGRFTIDGVEYKVATNNGPNHLHGGVKGFDKAVWQAKTERLPHGVAVRFTHTSPDGDEGYPGNLTVTVVYTLTDENELKIDYTAQTDKPTTINLTNHTYWNLADGGKSPILGHLLTLHADRYVAVDDTLIPTGELKAVARTPLDFTRQTPIGARIDAVGSAPVGYDHCYVLNRQLGRDLTPAAKVVEPKSGRVLEMFTTEPGVQLYTANFLDGSLTSRGATYAQQHAFCLEAQHFPDSINQPGFPSTLLRPGETYRQTTVYRFSVE